MGVAHPSKIAWRDGRLGSSRSNPPTLSGTNLLIGSGLTTAACYQANAGALGMGKVEFNTESDAQINIYAQKSAAAMGRGDSNIEDQFRSALMLLDGLKVLGDATKHDALETALNTVLHRFLRSVLATENGIDNASDNDWKNGVSALQSFLLSFASRSASRERLHVFTTNYDRLVEYGCDLAGIRIIDRFVGALNPVFRSTRVEVDMHYNPPGIRGELPRKSHNEANMKRMCLPIKASASSILMMNR